MTAYAYILGCQASDGCRTYVGWTLDLNRRLAEHNSGTALGA
ncbi:GIY-YIG nuclease family protein [Paracoccus litorisediminis]